MCMYSRVTCDMAKIGSCLSYLLQKLNTISRNYMYQERQRSVTVHNVKASYSIISKPHTMEFRFALL